MNKYEKICQNLIKQIDAGKRTSPLKAIRCKCLDCMCYQVAEIRKCPILDCSLYKFRFGANKSGARGTSKINPTARKRLGIAVK